MFRILKLSFLASWLMCISFKPADIDNSRPYGIWPTEIAIQQRNPDESSEIQKIAALLQRLNSRRDLEGIQRLSDSLKESIEKILPDSSILGESYYFVGVCNLLTGKYNDAITWLKRSVSVKNNLNLTDEYSAKSNYNIGVAYNYLGEFTRMKNYMLEYIRISKIIYSEFSPEVASGYTYLVSASIELQEYESTISYASSAQDIVKINKIALHEDELSNLYATVGTCYGRMSDYAKARIYFEKAESVLNTSRNVSGENYISLINNLAIIYGNLGLTDKQSYYYEKGIALAQVSNSSLAYNLVNSYAVFLGNTGQIIKGENLLSGLVEKARNFYGINSRDYIEVLNNFANYLRVYKNDNINSLKVYSDCINYLKNHDEEVILRDPVNIGYALALSESGESLMALEIIQELLFYELDMNIEDKLYANPELISLKTDRKSLNILRAKHDILWDIYSKSDKYAALEAAASTSELLISLLEKVRINISEEESRLLLGDRYRDSYLIAIRDFELCYRTTQQIRFLERVFEYLERSKVAGLLAATRELDAVQFHIPPDISELEKSFEREISLYNAKINSENSKESPDENSISDWNEKVLKATQRRDSLVLEFENKYPDYYSLKYNTRVLKMDEIPEITGWNSNYLSYVVSDSLLYLFLVNRKHQQLLTFRIDSAFFYKIREFRRLLSMPSPSANARKPFEDYQEIGYDLYKILIEPVQKYFISDKILISPDNILSYLPFETLLSAKYSGTGILYRELQYLMNDFSISYTYSATFMEELVKRNYGRKNELVAFAPTTPAISIDSILLKRQQQGKGILYDLPYARQEAEYISHVTGGRSYLNNEAKESVYKTESPKYDIIHLAMHTFLNDQYPMNSAMIFSQINDTTEDGMLHTYEVYGIPLKARMVVLSSCNTGMGLLFSGEGILSLARGFLYSGSQSVVMSMWEIEDKSGLEIMKMFYDNLKRGNSKSESLKKARANYLGKANQMTSHPYFWSSLVVYGNNAPLYSSRKYFIAGFSILFVAAALLARYFLKRKYS
ncbi:MAG: CHAT domain-containing protein [Bacteroidales bacterium]|nr:CHAT domain-containing protein [Bacteroidales bacterium]